MSIGVGSSCSNSSCSNEHEGSIGGLSSCGTRDSVVIEDTRPAAADPTVFRIEKIEQVGSNILVARVRYPICANYEGRKILVYLGVSKETLLSAKSLDPHFCDSCKTSPIARFVPDERGWLWATAFANLMHKGK